MSNKSDLMKLLGSSPTSFMHDLLSRDICGFPLGRSSHIDTMIARAEADREEALRPLNYAEQMPLSIPTVPTFEIDPEKVRQFFAPPPQVIELRVTVVHEYSDGAEESEPDETIH